jgi:hypothetical protein
VIPNISNIISSSEDVPMHKDLDWSKLKMIIKEITGDLFNGF